MSILFLNDLDKVCRGCLGKNGEMRPLFGSFLDNMLRTVAEIEVGVPSEKRKKLVILNGALFLTN